MVRFRGQADTALSHVAVVASVFLVIYSGYTLSVTPQADSCTPISHVRCITVRQKRGEGKTARCSSGRRTLSASYDCALPYLCAQTHISSS